MTVTKIKEIIYTHKLDANRRYKDGSFSSAMKEYAEWYAKKCLKIAAEQALLKKEFTMGEAVYFTQETEENNYMMTVSKDSILNIKLPDHD